MTSEAKYEDYDTPDKRRESFLNYPKPYPTVQRLVEAGFYYVGVYPEDECQCYFCGVKLFQWKENDDPMQEHRKFRPNCEVVKKANNFESMTFQATGASPQNYSANYPQSDAAIYALNPNLIQNQPTKPTKPYLYTDLNVINHGSRKIQNKETMYSSYQQEKPPDEQLKTVEPSPSPNYGSHYTQYPDTTSRESSLMHTIPPRMDSHKVYNTSQGDDFSAVSPRAGIHPQSLASPSRPHSRSPPNFLNNPSQPPIPPATRPLQSGYCPDYSHATCYKPPSGLSQTVPLCIYTSNTRTCPLSPKDSSTFYFSNVTNGKFYRPQHPSGNTGYVQQPPPSPQTSQQFTLRPQYVSRFPNP